MGITGELSTSIDIVRDIVVPDDLAGDNALVAMRGALTLRNLVDHLAATLAGVLDRCGVAAAQGRSPRELLMSLGCAPSVAERLIRVGGALPSLPTLAAHAGEGVSDVLCRS